MTYIIAIIGGYLLGSIPFGLVLTKLAGTEDIRTIGSGNIGATNVLRTGRKDLAFATLILDSAKGAIAVFLIPFLLLKLGLLDMHHEGSCADVVTGKRIPCGEATPVQSSFFALSMLAGFFALVGHCYPIWLKFKGGKGVATTLGTLIALKWPLGLAACGLWFLSALLFRISSLSALIAVGFTPLIAHYIYDDANLSGLCAMITALVYIKHRENIKRLFAGEEPKIGKKKKDNA